jgi:hypothetical protein
MSRKKPAAPVQRVIGAAQPTNTAAQQEIRRLYVAWEQAGVQEEHVLRSYYQRKATLADVARARALAQAAWDGYRAVRKRAILLRRARPQSRDNARPTVVADDAGGAAPPALTMRLSRVWKP